MYDDSLLIRPAGPDTRRLLLIFHGVGATPASMVPAARQFADALPDAMVVAVASPFPSDISAGRQWFSVRGVTEADRPARVAAAMPHFVDTVRHWQRQAGVGAEHTWLMGFSQGAIMALEAAQLAPPLAAAVLAFAGRYAQLPDRAPQAPIHLLHGENDDVIAVAHARAAAARLNELGASVSLDTRAGVGHEPHPALVDCALARLRADGSAAA